MHCTRRRVSSAAAAPYSGYIDSTCIHHPPPPPPEEYCGAAVEEEMSSDATVLYREESDHEEEYQALLLEQGDHHLFDVYRREQPQGISHCGRNPNLAPSLGSFSQTTSLPVHHQPMPPIRSPPREVYHPRRRATLSWGFQQDMADYEASLNAGARTASAMMYRPQPTGYVIRNELQPSVVRPPTYTYTRLYASLSIHSMHRRASLYEPFIDIQEADLRRHYDGRTANNHGQALRQPQQPLPQQPQPPQPPHSQQQQQQQQQRSQPQKQTKSRRRGRRGGRGRRHSERPTTDEVPKLEKNLEDELAQEMANHISNKSALAQSFSSLRLHVAGGDTMIILNDKEIPAGNSTSRSSKESQNCHIPSTSTPAMSEDVQGHYQQLQPSLEAESFPDGTDSVMSGGVRVKGCGAFFPPQVLRQLQHDLLEVTPPHHHSIPTTSTPSTPTSRLNVKAIPYTPTESTVSVDRMSPSQQQQCPHGKLGTGCFIPAYSQECASPAMDPSKELESVSLAESLACLENSEDLLNTSLEERYNCREICEATELSCSDASTPGLIRKQMTKRPAATSVLTEQSPNMTDVPTAGTDPGTELMQLIENDDYTTFTSPLHLDDTLDGLQAEREAREETEQKLINLQIEIEELRSGALRMRDLEAQLQKMKEYNSALQMMLFVELNNKHRAAIRCGTPMGMTPPARRTTMTSINIHAIEAEVIRGDIIPTTTATVAAAKIARTPMETDVTGALSTKKSKRDDRSSPINPKMTGRPKSQLKNTVAATSSSTKTTTGGGGDTKTSSTANKTEKRLTGVSTAASIKSGGDLKKRKELGAKDDTEHHNNHHEEKGPTTTVKLATGVSGVKKNPVPSRSKSRNQSADEDGRKNKKPLKTVTSTTTTNSSKHSRAASSSNALRV